MHRKQHLYTAFILFISVSLLLFVVSKSTSFSIVQGWGEKIVTPIQRTAYAVFGYPFSFSSGSEMKRLQEENRKLASQIIDQDKLKKEMQALRDQYSTEKVPHKQLIPVAIMSSRMVLSGLGQPTEIIVDKGSAEAVNKGAGVIYKDVLIGTVGSVSAHRSSIAVITSKETSLPVRTVKTNALGIIKGQGNGLLLDNVLLSEKLERGDVVVSKGTVDKNGVGIPPDMLIGTIVNVQKEPSALFQTAEVRPMLDVSELSTVFIIKRIE